MKLDYRAHQKESGAYEERSYASGQFVVYVNPKQVTATGYLRKSSKPIFNYRYKSLEQLEHFVSEKAKTIESNLERSAQYKVEAKAKRAEATEKFKAALKPGVLLYDTWGYDQTNVEFYEVIAVKGSKVTIRELHHVQVGEPTSWASNKVVPATGEHRFSSPEATVNIRGPGIKISDCISLSLYTGGEVHKSWYA